MRPPQAIWVDQAAVDLASNAPRVVFRPNGVVGAVLLRLFGKRIFSYDVADVPKIAWLTKALRGTGQKTLDIGVRAGATARFLMDQGKTVYGIDIAAQYIEHCKSAGHIADGWVCDIEAQEIPGGPYDLIYFSEVIEHLLDGRGALQRISRAIKPSGFLILTTPNLAYLVNRIRLLLGRDLDSLTIDRGEVGHQHIRVFTARLLQHICAEAGLTVDMIGTDGLPLKVPCVATSGAHPPTFVLPAPATLGRTLFLRARRD